MAFSVKDWRNQPDHSTPISAAALEDLETRVTDYTDDRVDPVESGQADGAFLPVNFFDPVPTLTDATSKAQNVTAFNAAIVQANIDGRPLLLPPGDFSFTANTTLTQLATCPGMLGVSMGLTILRFSNNGDCVKLKGHNKVCRNLSIVNSQTTHSAKDAVLRIVNCSGGRFENIVAYTEGNNSRCILLEHSYDGSADDAYTLVHLGSWYNRFDNVQGQYINSGANTGYGLAFEVDSSAVAVVNPPGQPAGTYTGSVLFNLVTDMSSESHARGINLDRASNNTFIGGLIGGLVGVYGRNGATSNVFDANRWSNIGTQLADLDSSCFDNECRTPTIFPQNTPYGNWGSRPRFEDQIGHIIGGTNDGLSPPAFATNWSSAAGYESASFWKQGATVYLTGMVTKSTGITQNDIIFTLPAGYRPQGTQDITVGTVVSGVAGLGVLRIASDGTVRWLAANAVANSTMELSSVAFRGV